MPQKTYMYDTQWNQLINAINTGDSSAIVTAISNIKTSIDNIYTRLNAVGFNSTQWDNLVDAINTGDSSAVITALNTIKNSLDNIKNAIVNQSITVDLSNINSDNVLNLSNVTGENITNAFNNLNSTLVRKDKMYRFLLNGNVSAGESFTYISEYAPDNDIYIDGTNIKFRRSSMIRIFVHLAGSPTSQVSQKRVWARLFQNSTVVATLIQYGDYTSQSTERIMSVSDSTSVSIKGVESILLNAGGIGPSYVEIQWIS